MSNFIKDETLDSYVKNELNVLFIGEAGVGKTSLILDTFNRNKLKFRYYSASTMDPWVDLVGIPKERTDIEGNVYLDLIRPREWAEDEVEAIFVDEFNRAPKKVKNALMELIQFKSMNGKKYNNLKLVWAAINPEESENPNAKYDVEPLDPAQKDRFHVHIDIPYTCSTPYFVGKYGAIGKILLEWWNKLDKARKYEVSPRRLDYIASAIQNDLELKFFLPKTINIDELVGMIKSKEFEITVVNKSKESEDERKVWMNSANVVNRLLPFIDKNPSFIPHFYHLLKRELLVSSLNDKKFNFRNHLNRIKEYKEKIVELIGDENILANSNIKVEFNNDEIDTQINQLLQISPVGTADRYKFFEGLPIKKEVVNSKYFNQLIERLNQSLDFTNSFGVDASHQPIPQKNLLAFLYMMHLYQLGLIKRGFAEMYIGTNMRCKLTASSAGVYSDRNGYSPTNHSQNAKKMYDEIVSVQRSKLMQEAKRNKLPKPEEPEYDY